MRSFDYHRAATLDEAVSALAQAGGNTRLLAGGTTLVDLMRLGVEAPSRLVDIGGIAELQGYDVSGPGEMRFGALARMSEVADDPLLRRDYPALSEALLKGASGQLRNMASLGGNLLQRTRCAYFRTPDCPCNKRAPGSGCPARDGQNRGHAVLGGSVSCVATYPGDWAVALAAFDAVVDVTGQKGAHSIALSDFYCLPRDRPDRETTLAPGEIVTRIRVAKTPAGAASCYHKVRDRSSYAFALASAAVALVMDGEHVREARIALGGVATVPWRCHAAEASLVGRVLDARSAREAGRIALAGAEPLAHNRFKLALGVETVAKVLLVAKARA